MCKMQTGYAVFLAIGLLTIKGASSYEVCNNDDLICPEYNTCCSMGCIPSDLGKYNATCCDFPSNGDELKPTGCGVGYRCSPDGKCIATNSIPFDPLVQVLPRYTLCRPTKESLANVYGLTTFKNEDSSVAKLAYYSSHGDIEDDNGEAVRGNKISRFSHVEVALIIIHGANRNADDYFCSGTLLIDLQAKYDKSAIMLIAPRFLSATDEDVELSSGGIPLRWEDKGSGPWRYGANAIHPRFATNVSSYDAIDILLEKIQNKTMFPSLKAITVAGHSSGGQFVQRWSLLTSQWNRDDIQIRFIVANPSSYAYLTPYRYLNKKWQIPNATTCPNYNKWEWGLADGGDYTVPYKDNALQLIHHNVSYLMHRFLYHRDVVYLIGSLDKCNTTKTTWCNSHRLETSCMDQLQGRTRYERSFNYFESLLQLPFSRVSEDITQTALAIKRRKTRRRQSIKHKHLVVSGVGHDHSLMFSSEVGLASIFFMENDFESYVEASHNRHHFSS